MAGRDRLHELFRSSAVIELHVEPSDRNGAGCSTIAAAGRTEEG